MIPKPMIVPNVGKTYTVDGEKVKVVGLGRTVHFAKDTTGKTVEVPAYKFRKM